jgi:hypothetical protein
MSNINIEIGKSWIERARQAGFELYTLPGQNQLRSRQIGQMTHQPSDGTPAGDSAKAIAEQFDGEMRQMAPTLSADINNNRGSILIALAARHPVPIPTAPLTAPMSTKMPGYGDNHFGVFGDES